MDNSTSAINLLSDQFVFEEMTPRERLPAPDSQAKPQPVEPPAPVPPQAGGARGPSPAAQQRWSLEDIHAADESGQGASAGPRAARPTVDGKVNRPPAQVNPTAPAGSPAGSSRMRLPLAHVQNISPVHAGTPRGGPQSAVSQGFGSVESWQLAGTSSHWQVMSASGAQPHGTTPRSSSHSVGSVDLLSHRYSDAPSDLDEYRAQTDWDEPADDEPDRGKRFTSVPQYVAIAAGSILSLAGTLALVVAQLGGH